MNPWAAAEHARIVSDKPDASGGGGDQRELVARLRAVIEAKDSENAMLRAELQAHLERYRRLLPGPASPPWPLTAYRSMAMNVWAGVPLQPYSCIQSPGRVCPMGTSRQCPVLPEIRD